LRPAYTNAWLRRARCELQLKELTASEISLKEVFRLNPGNAEGLNTLGLAQLQRNKPRDAAQSFSAALKSQPAHRAALLNLAITTHQQLNDRPAALSLYRQYLALTPRAADWDAVNALAQSLQPPPAPVPVVQTPARPIESPTATNTPNTPAVKVAEIVPRQTTNAKPAPPNPAPAPTPTPVVQASNPPAEVVRLPPEPVIRTVPVEDHSIAARPKPVPVTNQSPTKTTAEPTPDKRGFLSRVNPANLFRKEARPTNSAPLPDDNAKSVADAGNDVTVAVVAPGTGGFPRYQYLSPARPASGNRNEAERLLAQGRREQGSQKMTEAVQSYRAAVGADPGYFDAQFALGYASYQIRSYKLSTWAWEHALAIHPDSADARYNFALALRAMNCVPEAANELERVLRADDTVTKAHLTLGSIYAEPLKNLAKARLHYRRVLDLEPSHPRGADIRQWLVSNKP
jgi:tetratricopeptide (TPR) repeat protein